MALCPLCRTEVPFGEGTLLKAGRRSLAIVHREPCARVVQQGVSLAGRTLLSVGELVLQQRAPGLMAAVKTVRSAIARSSKGMSPPGS